LTKLRRSTKTVIFGPPCVVTDYSVVQKSVTSFNFAITSVNVGYTDFNHLSLLQHVHKSKITPAKYHLTFIL